MRNTVSDDEENECDSKTDMWRKGPIKSINLDGSRSEKLAGDRVRTFPYDFDAHRFVETEDHLLKWFMEFQSAGVKC